MTTIVKEDIKILQTLKKHTNDVTSCDFTPNFSIVTGSSDKTVRIWDWIPAFGYTERAFSPLKGHKYGITCVKVSPQGSMLATTSIDGTAVLWNLHSGTKIHTMVQMNGDAIRVCRFAPDSSVLITAGDNGAICIWDLIHRSLIRTLFHHEGTTQSLAFTPDSQYFISACSLEEIRVWDIHELADTTNDDNACTSLAFIDNAHDMGILCIDISNAIKTDDEDPLLKTYTLATCGNSQEIKLWSVVSHMAPKHEQRPHAVTIESFNSLNGHTSAVTCVKYNSNGTWLLSASLDRQIKIWSSEGACLATLRGHSRYVNCCAISKDNVLVASGSNDKAVIVWDLSGQLTSDSEIAKLHVLIGSHLQSVQEQHLVQSAETANGFELIEKIDDISEGAINSCNFFGNDILGTGSSDRLVRIFKLEENNNMEEMSCSPLDGHSYAVNHVEFSRDGTCLATCSLDGCAIIWDPVTGIKKGEITQNELAIKDCRFSPDGELLVTVGDDEKAHVWSASTGDHKATFQGHSDAVTSACFSCDGNIIATTSSNGDFRLWTIANDNIYIENVAHDLGIQNCDFSQNLNPIPHQPMRDAQDYLLSTCGNDSLVKLWKIVTPKEPSDGKLDVVEVSLWRSLQGHGGSVICVRFSPNSAEIVCSTATDRQARLWSVYSAECLYVLDQDSITTCCAFNNICTVLAVGCIDGTLWLWKLPEELTVRSTLTQKFVNCRRKPLVNWSTEDVVNWLKDISFSSITTNVVNSNLDGQKILTFPEDRICFGLDLDEEQTDRFAQELKWLKRDELRTSLPDGLNIPSEFLCPITQEIMRNPVKCSDGFTYEKQAITEWFVSGKYTSPMTNAVLADTNYEVNQELRSAIHSFLYEE